MSDMRILMLAQNFAPIIGGEERIVEDLSGELVRRGHTVAVATIPQAGLRPQDAGNGVRIHALRSSFYRARPLHRGTARPQAPPLPDPETMLDLWRVLRRERPDVVHAHNWIVHSYLPLHRWAKAALVLSLHDYGLSCATKRMLYRGAQCSGPGPAKCARCAAEHYGGVKGVAVAAGVFTRGPGLRESVDLFLPVSAAVRDSCRLRGSDRCRVIPNFFRELPRQRIDDDRLDRLPLEPFVLFLGDVAADKGARTLADAYGKLDHPPPLVFVGRCLVEGLADDRTITVVGPWPPELAREAIRRSLFVVVPSIVAESFGLVALEGAAAGKAVVASDVGGLGEIVLDGESGLLVAPGDPDALSCALRRLIEDEPLRRRMGDAASRHAASFSADAIVPAFEDAYRVATANRRYRNVDVPIT